MASRERVGLNIVVLSVCVVAGSTL